jgi:hypothetical protein
VGVSPLEIHCPGCSADSLLRREPVYEGLRKIGERLFCAACGHPFASEADVPFKQRQQPAVFGAGDRPRRVEIFRGDEKGRNCRHCRHYVKNPFIQRCGRHHREVQATDLCADLETRPTDAEKKPEPF